MLLDSYRAGTIVLFFSADVTWESRKRWCDFFFVHASLYIAPSKEHKWNNRKTVLLPCHTSVAKDDLALITMSARV